MHQDPSTQPEPGGGQHRAPHHQHPSGPTYYLLTLLPDSSEPHVDLWGREGPSERMGLGTGPWAGRGVGAELTVRPGGPGSP